MPENGSGNKSGTMGSRWRGLSSTDSMESIAGGNKSRLNGMSNTDATQQQIMARLWRYSMGGMMLGIVLGVQLSGMLSGRNHIHTAAAYTYASVPSLGSSSSSSSPPPPQPPPSSATPATASPVSASTHKSSTPQHHHHHQRALEVTQGRDTLRKGQNRDKGHTHQQSEVPCARAAHRPASAQFDYNGPAPGPQALSPSEVKRWVDILSNYTRDEWTISAPVNQDSPAPRRVGPAMSDKPTDGPTDIKEYWESGRCKHADMYLAHIQEKLQTWSRGGITREMTEEAVRQGRSKSSFASLHYQVVGQEVYARSEGNGLYMDEYARLMAHTLQHIRVPDVEFALHNGKDLPVMLKHEVHPILAYAGADSFNEVLVPCPWYVMDLARKMGEEQKQGGFKPPSLDDFKERQSKVVWRGSPNDFLDLKRHNAQFAPRFKLVEMSRKRPDLLDAEITSSLVLIAGGGWELECWAYAELWGTTVEGHDTCNQDNVAMFRKAQEDKKIGLGQQGDKYRYVLNLDGTGVSERYASQLAGPAAVFKVASPFYNYYSRFFEPWVHYIPIKYDLSDLLDKIEWANEHPEEVHAIMTAANRWAREVFRPDEVTCYTALVLLSYGRLLGYDPEIRVKEGVQRYTLE